MPQKITAFKVDGELFENELDALQHEAKGKLLTCFGGDEAVAQAVLDKALGVSSILEPLTRLLGRIID